MNSSDTVLPDEQVGYTIPGRIMSKIGTGRLRITNDDKLILQNGTELEGYTSNVIDAPLQQITVRCLPRLPYTLRIIVPTAGGTVAYDCIFNDTLKRDRTFDTTLQQVWLEAMVERGATNKPYRTISKSLFTAVVFAALFLAAVIAYVASGRL